MTTMTASERTECTETNIDYGLVSVIMPNYNSEKYVKNTVESVLRQTYANWELIFVDDFSTDSSLSIVESFHDERIRIFRNRVNQGAAVSRNVGIEAARGKWIAFLDSDDLWLPDKLSKQLTYMVENGYDFTCTSYEVINENAEKLAVFIPKKERFTYRDILKHNHIGCLTVIYHAERLGKVMMPPEAIKREDLACWLSILRNGTPVHCMPDVLSVYKVHKNSVSSNKWKMIRYQWNVLRKVEGLSLIRSSVYMLYWAILGVLKYR